MWQRLFPGQENELRQLRRWLTALLPDRPARDDFISVAVELGTNAIQHTSSGQGGWFTVEVTQRGAVARIDVTDQGAASGPELTDDPMSDRGRGLIIVRALSESCGVRGDARGRTVWAEVAWAPEPVPVSRPVPLSSGHGTRDHAQRLPHPERPPPHAPGWPSQGRRLLSPAPAKPGASQGAPGLRPSPPLGPAGRPPYACCQDRRPARLDGVSAGPAGPYR